MRQLVSTSLTKRQLFAVRSLLFLVITIHVVLIGFFSVLLKDYLHHKACYLAYLEIQRVEIAELTVSLEKLQQRVSLIGLIKRRARGLSREEHLALVDTLLEQHRLYGYSPSLLLALIQVESSFNNFAISPRGAIVKDNRRQCRVNNRKGQPPTVAVAKREGRVRNPA